MRSNVLRMDDNGVVEPYWAGGPQPARGSRVILLVHGYNNDEAQAADGYFAMRRNLDNILRFCAIDEARRKNFQSTIWELHWPGFLPLAHRGRRGLRRAGYESILSAPSYSLEVLKARDWVPDGLARFLTRVQPAEVFFIAHSLGCRVVLETLARLCGSVDHHIVLAGFLLMAGAVPIHLLAPSEVIGACLHTSKRRYCLYSWRDAVLMSAFPPGEVMAGEIPPYGTPVATGLLGAPRSLWSSHVNTRLNHGGYWKEGLLRDKTLLAAFCAGVIGVAMDRPIAETEILSLPASLPASVLPERQLFTGSLPGADWLAKSYGP